MQITTDSINKLIQISFADQEWVVLGRAVSRHGVDTVKAGFRQWLREWWTQQENERLETLRNPIPATLGE